MSSVFAGPPFVVNGPFPVPPPHRLIDVATLIPDGDPHWRNGAQVWAYPCYPPDAIAPCLTGTFAEKTAAGEILLPEFGAFTAYLPVTCTARSIGNDAEFVQRAVDVFTAVESLAVEREFAMGDQQPINPFLADGNVDTPLGVGAIDPIDALAALEDAIGASGKAGLIHVTPAIAAALSAQYLIEERSSGLWTIRGTRVVVGDGYIGATPTGAAPAAGTGWMFATGPVAYRRGEVVVVPGSLSEALDRSSNTVTFLAERDYLIYWDTCVQAAVLVDYDACCGGGGGGGGGGDASAANQLTEIAALQAIEACTCERGQEVMAASFPVVIASDQSEIPVSISDPLPAGTNNIGDVDVASLPPLPAGTNNIGDVDVLSLPPIPAGTNNIGDVDVLTLPSLPAGANNIGDVDVLTLPALPAGNNNIGDVDVATLPKSGTAVQTSPTGSGANQTIQASNAARKGLMIYNSSGVSANVKLGGAATSTDFTVLLVNGAYYELPGPEVYTGAVHAIWASGDLQVTELT